MIRTFVLNNLNQSVTTDLICLVPFFAKLKNFFQNQERSLFPLGCVVEGHLLVSTGSIISCALDDSRWSTCTFTHRSLTFTWYVRDLCLSRITPGSQARCACLKLRTMTFCHFEWGKFWPILNVHPQSLRSVACQFQSSQCEYVLKVW